MVQKVEVIKMENDMEKNPNMTRKLFFLLCREICAYMDYCQE